MLNFGERLCKFCCSVSVTNAPYCANCGRPLLVVENASIVNMGFCPQCGSKDIWVRQTLKPKRYLGCRKCDYRWATFEVVLVHSEAFALAEKIMKNNKFLL
jgi:predicted RNA-binding Zn-ribbon protein involved in translation (DUF1610 family)